MVVPEARASSGAAGLAGFPAVPSTRQPSPASRTPAPSRSRAERIAAESSLSSGRRSRLVPSASAAHTSIRLVTLLLAGASSRARTGPIGSSSSAGAPKSGSGGGGGVDPLGVGGLVGGDGLGLG
jgi:hypothetical protein